MSKSRYTIELDDGDRGAASMIEALKNDARFSVHVDQGSPPPLKKRETLDCIVCGETHPAITCNFHPDIRGALCPLCFRAGSDLIEAAKSARNRHWRSVLARMPEFIRRKRAGDPDPVFYSEAGE